MVRLERLIDHMPWSWSPAHNAARLLVGARPATPAVVQDR